MGKEPAGQGIETTFRAGLACRVRLTLMKHQMMGLALSMVLIGDKSLEAGYFHSETNNLVAET